MWGGGARSGGGMPASASDGQASPTQPPGQSAFAPGRHAPAPSHALGASDTPLLHDGSEHGVAALGNAQRSARTPSHAPAQRPMPPHAGRPPTGAPRIGVHVPAAPP